MERRCPVVDGDAGADLRALDLRAARAQEGRDAHETEHCCADQVFREALALEALLVAVRDEE